MEELRLQIFLYFLNYWRLYQNRGVDMGDVMRAIYESMPPIPECAREGCDELVFSGVPWLALYCGPECQGKAWHEAHPDYISPCIEANPDYEKDWREANPDYISPSRAANPDYDKETGKAWREANPEMKKAGNKKWREANKEHIAEYNKAYDARKKAERLAAEEQTSP